MILDLGMAANNGLYRFNSTSCSIHVKILAATVSSHTQLRFPLERGYRTLHKPVRFILAAAYVVELRPCCNRIIQYIGTRTNNEMSWCITYQTSPSLEVMQPCEGTSYKVVQSLRKMRIGHASRSNGKITPWGQILHLSPNFNTSWRYREHPRIWRKENVALDRRARVFIETMCGTRQKLMNRVGTRLPVLTEQVNQVGVRSTF